MEDVTRSWDRRGERKEEQGEEKRKDRGKEKREGEKRKEKGERDVARGWEKGERDRIEDMYPAPCFPHGLKEISMEFLDQHLLCTLWGGGEGVKKKRTFCTLVKMSIIMDDP